MVKTLGHAATSQPTIRGNRVIARQLQTEAGKDLLLRCVNRAVIAIRMEERLASMSGSFEPLSFQRLL